MIRILTLFHVIFLFGKGYAGNLKNDSLKIDSLTLIIQGNSDDLDRANAYIELTDLIYYANPDTIYHIHRVVKDICDKKSTAVNRKDFLKISGANHSNLAYHFNKISKLDSALFYYQKTVHNYKLIRDTLALAQVYNHMAYWYSENLNLDSAKSYIQKSIQLSQAIGDVKQLILGYNELSHLYELENRVNYSIEYLYKSLKLLDEIDSPKEKIIIHNNIAVLSVKLKEFKLALSHCRKGLKLCKQGEYKNLEALLYNNIGDIYNKMSHYDTAIYYFNRGLDKYLSIHNERGIGNSYLLIGDAYLNKGQLDSALLFALKSLELRENSNQRLGLSTFSKYKVCHIYFLKKNYRMAKKYGLEAFEEAQLLGLKEAIATTSKVLSVIYEHEGNFKEALQMNRISSNLEDSLWTTDNQKEMLRQQLTYEYNKKQMIANNEIQLLNEKQRASGLELALAKRQRAIFFGIGMVLFVFLALLLLFYRQNKRKNTILNVQKKRLEMALEENALLLKEVHHRVKNNLQMISSLLSLQSRSVENLEALDILKAGQNRVKSVALIHQKLYQDKDISKINLKDYVNQLFKHIQSLYFKKEKEITLESNINDELQLDIDTAVPLGLIINELITNSFKYAFIDVNLGRIQISVDQEADKFKLLYKDSGKGLPKDFSFEGSGSFGMKLTQLLTKQLQGTITYSVEQGFVIEFYNLEYRKKSA